MTTLLVTNDFPPTVGGIQSYLRDYAGEFVARAGAGELIVFASTQDAEAAREWDAGAPYEVIRWPGRVMLPTPAVRRRMQAIIRARGVETVWFGAAAPLAVMGGAAKAAGAVRVVATTHGHEVGWSMIPLARGVLHRVGESADVITYISEYTLRRFRRAFGTRARYVALPSGVDTAFFRPATPGQRHATRGVLGVGDAPLIVCASRLVARKGQDQLIRVMPRVRSLVDGTRLVIVGTGPYGRTLRALAADLPDADRGSVMFTGAVSRDELRDLVAAADVFAMPARTRGGGLDVEGLGIVYLEAQACGVPVVAGDSGGAPETVGDGGGVVVGGRDTEALAEQLGALLRDAPGRAAMGEAGRRGVEKRFAWDELGDRLFKVLTGGH